MLLRKIVALRFNLDDKRLFLYFLKISGSYLVDSGDFEEEDEDDDDEVDYYPCPFCSDDYDLVELCHHIDEEHQLEATHGVSHPLSPYYY